MDKLLTDEELILELQRRFNENKISLEKQKKLTKELIDLNKKLEESEAMKSHFISNITNEIINPFASIIGLSRNIMLVKENNWDKVRSMVSLIHLEAFNLDFQLRNIFSAAKIEAGEINVETINTDVISLIQNVITEFNHEAVKRNIEIKFDFDVNHETTKTFYFNIDADKFKLILSNLISNALKFNNENGLIEVKVSVKNKVLNLCVIDNGIGISEGDIQIIFNRFKKIDDNINSINPGHGLGLSIVKAFVEILNGKIDLESDGKKGTCFCVSIPEAEKETSIYTDNNSFDDFSMDGASIIL